MNQRSYLRLLPHAVFALMIAGVACAQDVTKDNCFYLSSLHATARGMSYWYDASRGGLESRTGIPYADLGCGKCHVASCDACHANATDGKRAYSSESASNQGKCLGCHARESHMIMKIDKEANTPDVHVAQGMTCMDCHTAREIHGDGIEYTSMKAPGAMDATCEQCHASPTPSRAHTIHGGKLDCTSCHVRHVVSCNSCHVETMLKEKKRVSRPVSGWKFLMNHNGKVRSANMQTFVAPGNKTFMIFAPQFSHSVMKNGTPCEECHGTKTVEQILAGDITLTWLDAGKEKNLRGVVPVMDGVKYQCVYQNYEKGTWTPIPDPSNPMIQYVGFGSPLTREQVARMRTPQRNEK